jgi:hypothetical protein
VFANPMLSDPLPTFVYCLIADSVTIGFVTQAVFPTLQLFEFEAPLSFDQRFLDSAGNHGYLPFHRWSLITLNTALQEVGRVVWHQARVVRLRFPELNAASSRPLRIVVQMAVGSVREEGPPARTSAGGASALSRRADPLPFFCVETVIDGLGRTFAVTKIDAFYLGDHAPDEVVLTVSPEASADLFRTWLGSGNTPRTGSLRLLNTALRAFLTINLTGLRVRNVTPAITTHAPNPATVRLTYGEVRFTTNT